MPSKAPEPTATFSKVLAGYRTSGTRHTAMLTTWREHPDKEKLWQALLVASQADHRNPPMAMDFIGVVLSSTRPVKILNDHNDLVLEQFEKLKRKIKVVVADADYPL